ncbi:2-hydroxyacid dehydrogenase [Pleionea litopenaei]|uniref:2-hydroxyacid dehydrogenase n=1 Tax=Pleionea litopenaei TaxID=3070815 RepID=A0AA51RRQ2_9GAMM|nr:2-hydroxyacid dehydrogenase [Pleionea sp. HL-JVS1]WMS86433.1 2-hydroxyacid dehydrogenase [Pleionea sp. HL-JVS1]
MKVAMFSSKPYDREYFVKHNRDYSFELDFFDDQLNETTVAIAAKYEAVCVFVNDRLNKQVLTQLSQGKTQFIALRCAGYNNLDWHSAKELKLRCARVPDYSPTAVAEHVLAMLLTLYRSTHKAYNRVKEGNFSLYGLNGQEVRGKTVALVGTGKIGKLTAEIFKGLGCELYAYDIQPDHSWANSIGLTYIDLPELYAKADIISLHCPLTDTNRHMINAESLAQMKPGVTLINTSRGGLVDTEAAYQALKDRTLGYLAIDVYEEEANLFFEDLSTDIIMDDLFMRLTTFPNVLVTGHQGFFTEHALNNIARTTLENLAAMKSNQKCVGDIV